MVPNISGMEMGEMKNGSHHHAGNGNEPPYLQGNGIGMMTSPAVQESASASPANQSDASYRVTFNVGGTIFQTTEATLSKTYKPYFKVTYYVF